MDDSFLLSFAPSFLEDHRVAWWVMQHTQAPSCPHPGHRHVEAVEVEFVKNRWFFEQNGVKCVKNTGFYKYPTQVGQIL